MKKTLFFFIIFLFLSNCSILRKKSLIHSLSTLENIKVFSPTKEESVIIDSLKEESKKFLEKCKKNGEDCIDDDPRQDAYFKTGATGFRKIIFEQFKVNAESREGENKMLVTIGKKNSIESMEFLKFTDDDSKKQLENILKSKELNQWSSAKNYGLPVETQFEISLYIEKR